MAKGIDTFTKGDFEAALPKHKETGLPLWTYAGFLKGEHCYIIRPFGELPFGILVRSSVGDNGINKDCGEDSIRGFIVKVLADGTGYKACGGKSQRWVTRVAGWQDRMLEMFRKLTNQIRWCRPCPKCGESLLPFTTKDKESENKGRSFVSCRAEACQRNGKSITFFWTEDEEGNPISPPAELLGKPPTNADTPHVATTPKGLPCPRCRIRAVGQDKFGGPDALYCFPRAGGCGWKAHRIDLEATDNAEATTAPVEDVRPSKAKPDAYELLRRLTVAALEYMDDANKGEPLGATYCKADSPVAKLKSYLRSNK